MLGSRDAGDDRYQPALISVPVLQEDSVLAATRRERRGVDPERG